MTREAIMAHLVVPEASHQGIIENITSQNQALDHIEGGSVLLPALEVEVGNADIKIVIVKNTGKTFLTMNCIF